MIVELSGAPARTAQSAATSARVRALAQAQAEVASMIGEAVPEARVRWRYQHVLNAVAVELPRSALGALERLPGVQRVVESVPYGATLDSSPAPITPRTVEVQQSDSSRLDEELSADEDETAGGVAASSDDLEDTLGWQPQYAGQTILWGTITALVALVAWVLGRRWRRWTCYVLAAVPGLTCLFVFFTHLDKMLPAV